MVYKLGNASGDRLLECTGVVEYGLSPAQVVGEELEGLPPVQICLEDLDPIQLGGKFLLKRIARLIFRFLLQGFQLTFQITLMPQQCFSFIYA